MVVVIIIINSFATIQTYPKYLYLLFYIIFTANPTGLFPILQI